MSNETKTRRFKADYYTDLFQAKALAEVIGMNLNEGQRADVFQDFIEAAQALTEAKTAAGWDDLGPDKQAELRERYNVLLNVCYAAGYETADVSPYWPPIG